MDIIFSSDNNYAPYLAISIFSILKNNINEHIHFFILDLGINKENKNAINNLITNYSCEVSFIPIDEKDFYRFPKTIEYISSATYARLNLTYYIKDIDKAIYIDVDTLTNGSLKDLWDIDLEDYALAACQDTFIDIEHTYYKSSIGLDKNIYFNAGILLLNLKKWREENVFQCSVDWMNKYRGVMKYQDQDILNGIFKDKVKIINNRFNFTPSERNLIRNRYKTNTDMPVVIYHYCGNRKFWHSDCDHAKSHIAYSLLKEMKTNSNFPSSWSHAFDEIQLFKKLMKIKKQISDRFKYKIY